MRESRETPAEYRVMPNRSSLFIGLALSGLFTLMFLSPGWTRWIAPLLALAFIVCLINIIWPHPIIRATTEGLYLGIGTFGRTSFYVPWERVNAIALTRVVPLGQESYERPALGFVIRQDDQFRLPKVRWNAAGQDVADIRTDIRFESGMMEGDVRTWAQQLEAFRKRVRHLDS